MDDIQSHLQTALSKTLFACSSLTRLSGGTANFVYRGVLRTPLAGGTKTIVIKHAEEYLASNREFRLGAERCVLEQQALRYLEGMQSVTTTTTSSSSTPSTRNSSDPDHDKSSRKSSQNQITAKTPKLYNFSSASNTQILEDLPDAVDLKTFLRDPDTSSTVTKEWAVSLGRTLGLWLREFHTWSTSPNQTDLARALGQNKTMEELKFSVNYDGLVNTIEKYPDILAECKGVFGGVRAMAAAEMEMEKGMDEDGDRDDAIGPIHGDFWSGNILLPKSTLTKHDQNHAKPLKLLITDWELSQIAHRGLDLAQMLAELYMIYHFDSNPSGLWVIEGFITGYGAISDEMAFRAMIHVGTHIVFWGSTVPNWGSEEQVKDAVKVGRDLVCRAWRREREWFVGHAVWGGLFGS